MARLSTQVHKLQETNKKLQKTNMEQQKTNMEQQKTNMEQQKTNMEQQKTNIEQQKEIEKLKAQLEKDEKSWSAEESSLRYSETSKSLHTIERLDNIINNEKRLKNLTGCTRDVFEYLLNQITLYWKKDPKAPLCTEDGLDKHGNRCKLSRRHVVLLTLERFRQGTKQPSLASHYDVDQGTVSKYLNYVISIMEKFLPTATNISKYLRTCTKKELERLVPKREILIDGTHVPIDRPRKNETREAYYSGKKKKFTINTTVCVNCNEVLLGIGRSVAGATHDLTMFREDGLDLGPITKSIKNPKTPYKEKFILRMDLGYLGIEEDLPGARIMMNKKKPKNRDLTDQELENNRRLNSKRVKVEHAIGRIKQYELMTGPYENTDEQFHREFNVITGLVNTYRLWDTKKKRPKLEFR